MLPCGAEDCVLSKNTSTNKIIFLRRDTNFLLTAKVCVLPNTGAARKHSRKNHCQRKSYATEPGIRKLLLFAEARAAKMASPANLYSNSTLVVFVRLNTSRVKTEKISYLLQQVSAYIKRYSEVYAR